MSTFEITWSNNELRRTRCFECVWLRLENDEIVGKCTLPDGAGIRIKIRDRSILFRKCSAKKQISPADVEAQ